MKAERAKIFAPYDALRGMYGRLRQVEETRVERAELSEDVLEYLNRFFSNLHEGHRIYLSYYDDRSGDYLAVRGEVVSFTADGKRIVLIPDEVLVRGQGSRDRKTTAEVAFADIRDAGFIE
ncbi:MAG: hypothetical protein IJI65_11045 [Lachnospiraceae bacterium]|nr:hypothetical protein [Lachnospiraceae bacterium]